MATKVDFPCASGGEGPVLQSLSALGLNVSSSTNRAMHDFVTKLALLSRMLGSVWCAICPYSSRTITGSASKAEKVPNFIRPIFPKKGVGKFSKKKYISGISKVSAFEWYASFFSPPTPSNEPYGSSHSLSVTGCGRFPDRRPYPSGGCNKWSAEASRTRAPCITGRTIPGVRRSIAWAIGWMMLWDGNVAHDARGLRLCHQRCKNLE